MREAQVTAIAATAKMTVQTTVMISSHAVMIKRKIRVWSVRPVLKVRRDPQDRKDQSVRRDLSVIRVRNARFVIHGLPFSFPRLLLLRECQQKTQQPSWRDLKKIPLCAIL